MRRLLFLLVGLVLLGTQLLAQNRTITGRVTDEQGAAISNASVVVKGTSQGTTTSVDGRFTLSVPPSAKALVISSVSFQTKEISLSGAATVNVTLSAGNTDMNEVVVVAYGTAKKESLTGAVASVNANQIAKRPVSSVTAALEGTTPGVLVNNTVGQPGSDPSIRIRGFTTVNGSNAPLYVLDGVPFGGNVSDLNPADIESISVLKDAASSSLWGNRAANGVIIITTKKGTKNSGGINVIVNQGIYDKGINEYEKLNANQFMEVMWKGYRNSLMTSNPTAYPNATVAGAEATKSLIQDILKLNIYNKPADALFDANGKLVAGASILPGYAGDLDWFKTFERKGHRQDYTISARTGSPKNSVYYSVNYLNEKGYIDFSDFKRFTGRINADLQANSWFKYGFNLGASHQESNNAPAGTGSATSIVNPVYYARVIAPIYPVYLHDPATGEYLYDANGELRYDDGSTYSRSQLIGRHAIWENRLNKDLIYRNTLNGQAYANITFLKDFTATIAGDLNARNNDEQTYNNAIIGDGAGNRGRASTINYRYYNYTIRQTLGWAQTFNRHKVDVLAGHENYNDEYNYLYGYKTTESFANEPALVNFTNITSLTGYPNVYRTESYYSRARYNFEEKYFAEASFRRDGTSRFYKDNRWGNFWSAGASWLISKEDFFQPLSKQFDYLKLRASYGEVGNDGGSGLYAWMALYTLAQNANATALYKVQNAANDLIWETSSSANAAIEGRMFNRVGFTVEYFDKRSQNLIFDVNLPLSAGATSSSDAESVITKNIGSVSNRGLEFSLDADLLKAQDFRLNLSFNATWMKNKVVKLPEQNRKNGIISGTKKIMEGHSIYDFWLYQFVGVDQMTGNALYLPNTTDYNLNGSAPDKPAFPTEYLVTINGQNYTTYTTYGKRDWSGSAIPDMFGSFGLNFSYKRLSLSSLFTYALGGKTYDNSYASLRSAIANPSALSKDLLNAWDGVPKGMTATSANRIDPKGIPVVDFTRSDKNNAGNSTQFLQNGSYLVVKNINLAYSLPPSLLSRLELKSLAVNVSLENLFTFTHLMGMNPQQSFNGTVTNGFTTPRVLSFGLNVGL